MIRRIPNLLPLSAAILFLGSLPLCREDTPRLTPPPMQGTEPRTYFTRGPADSADTNYKVRIGWGATIDEGEVSHYEIAWQQPSNWVRIDVPESLFATSTENCCTEPLPEFAAATDSTYFAFHTLYVRSVSEGGLTDATPVRLGFNSKSVAPNAQISNDQTMPQINPVDQAVLFCPDVTFEWSATDLDGEAVSYEYVLSSLDDYRAAHGGQDPMTDQELVDWLNESVPWTPTMETTVSFASLPSTQGTVPQNQHVFGVRAIDDNGNLERALAIDANVRRFEVQDYVEGPTLEIVARRSSVAVIGRWTDADPGSPLEITTGDAGVRFSWTGQSRPACRPIDGAGDGYSQKEPEAADFTPYEPALIGFPGEFPVQDNVPGAELWQPPGAAMYELIVRVKDSQDKITEVVVPINVTDPPGGTR